MTDSSTHGSEDEEATAEGDLDGQRLKGGITGFVVVSVFGILTVRAVVYFLRTHGDHAAPLDPIDAFWAYAPAAALYATAVAAAIVYLTVIRRRP
jgi:hypothetical protein